MAGHLGTTAARIRAERKVIRRRLRDERIDILLIDDAEAILDTDRVSAAFAEWAALDHNPKATPAEIEEALSGNICRCGTYEQMRHAIADLCGKKGE